MVQYENGAICFVESASLMTSSVCILHILCVVGVGWWIGCNSKRAFKLLIFYLVELGSWVLVVKAMGPCYFPFVHVLRQLCVASSLLCELLFVRVCDYVCVRHPCECPCLDQVGLDSPHQGLVLGLWLPGVVFGRFLVGCCTCMMWLSKCFHTSL